MATIIFYILSAVAILCTLLCVTREHPVHAIIYLVQSFFAVALLFYLLGAPLVAAWEVIIYAGAIMVLFLFIIMMLELAPQQVPPPPGWRRWLPASLLSAAILGCTLLIIAGDPGAGKAIPTWYVGPRTFGTALFRDYALGVEVISFQLLFAAVGGYYLGRKGPQAGGGDA